MFIIYDLIFIVFAIFYLPIFFFKKKFHPDLKMRFGFFAKSEIEKLKNKKVIWLHAVSVGETKVAKAVYELLKRDYPDYRIAFSTVTSTGNSVVKQFVKNEDFVFYFPLDLSFIVKRVVSFINPVLFISFETEIWPNLITRLQRQNVPQIILNGRISDRSFGGYKMIRFLLKNILAKIELFCMQTQLDKQRILYLGVCEHKVKICGNIKFDTAAQESAGKFIQEADKLRDFLGIKQDAQVFVAGSTHPKEEDIILEVYKKLLSNFPDLRLLIVPRHIERSDKIEGLVKQYGFIPQRISKLNLPLNPYPLPLIFILDTIGQLQNYYSLATVVFVGGSLVKKGGQNIIEPACQGKPVIFGPYMSNFADVSQIFLKRSAVIMVKDKDGLYADLKELLGNPQQACILGERARAVSLENQGATRRSLEFIKSYL